MTSDARSLQMTVAGVAALLVIGGALWFGFGPDPVPPSEPGALPTPSISDARIAVHVAGAVARPGVVEVGAEARVADAIAAAGGVTAEADLDRVNLAASVHDGDQVTVPSITERTDGAKVVNDAGVDINAASAAQLEELPGVGPVLAARIAEYRDAHGRFATVEDLLDVPGIGESKLRAMRDAIASP